MQTTLTQAFIINKLSINVKPELSISGNPHQKPDIVFDDHRDSPVSFSVKISLTKKTYVIQRSVSSSVPNVSEGKKPGSVLKVKVGHVSDFPAINEANNGDKEKVNKIKG